MRGCVCIIMCISYVPSVKFMTFILASGDIVIPSGTTILMSIINTHHDQELYPEPLVFNPENFNPTNIAKRHKYSYLPFSEGPRNCIGKTMLINIIMGKCGSDMNLIFRIFPYSLIQLYNERINTLPLFQDLLKMITFIIKIIFKILFYNYFKNLFANFIIAYALSKNFFPFQFLFFVTSFITVYLSYFILPLFFV